MRKDLKRGYNSDFGKASVPEKAVEELKQYISEQVEKLS